MVTDIGFPAGLDVGQVGKSFGRPMLFVDERRVGCHGLEHIENRGQRFVIHVHKLHRILGRALVRGGHSHYWIAHIANSLYRKDRLVAERWTEVWIHTGHGGDIRARQYHSHAFERRGPRFVDARYARMSIGTAQNRNVEHLGHFDIADVQRAPGYLGISIFSKNRLAHDRKISHKITLR
jgi:hypothetical protein